MLQGDRPLVSCICPTISRRASWFPTALACFLSQTYTPRELVVVLDPDDGLTFNYLNQVMLRPDSGFCKDVTWQGIKLKEFRTIGHKRNQACLLAAGEYVCHFDDDDFSLPTRVERQMSDLLSASSIDPGFPDLKPIIHGFRNVVFTNGTYFPVYHGTPGFMLGTSLCYSRAWALNHPFEDRMVCEDSQFCRQIPRHLAVVPDDDPCPVMYATIHESNTAVRSLTSFSWDIEARRPNWLTDERMHPCLKGHCL